MPDPKQDKFPIDPALLEGYCHYCKVKVTEDVSFHYISPEHQKVVRLANRTGQGNTARVYYFNGHEGEAYMTPVFYLDQSGRSHENNGVYNYPEIPPTPLLSKKYAQNAVDNGEKSKDYATTPDLSPSPQEKEAGKSKRTATLIPSLTTPNLQEGTPEPPAVKSAKPSTETKRISDNLINRDKEKRTKIDDTHIQPEINKLTEKITNVSSSPTYQIPIVTGLVCKTPISTLMTPKIETVSLFGHTAVPHVTKFYDEWRQKPNDAGRCELLAKFCVDVLTDDAKRMGIEALAMVTGSHRLGTQLKQGSNIDIVVHMHNAMPGRVIALAASFRERAKLTKMHKTVSFEDPTLGFVVASREGACAAVVFVTQRASLCQEKTYPEHCSTLEHALDSITHVYWFLNLPKQHQTIIASCTVIMKGLVTLEVAREDITKTPMEDRISPYLLALGPWYWLAFCHYACCVSGPLPINLAWAVRRVFEVMSVQHIHYTNFVDPCRPFLKLGTNLSATTREMVCVWGQNKLRLLSQGFWDRVLPLPVSGGKGVEFQVSTAGLASAEGDKRLVEEGFTPMALHPIIV